MLRASGPVLGALALCPLAAWFAPDDPTGPLARAAALGSIEAWLGLRFEPAAGGWLREQPALHDAAGFFYLWVHLPATVGVLVWVWLERRPTIRPARNTFVLAQVATVVLNLALVVAVVLATGNHVWFDAAAGAAIAAIALRVTA